MKSRTSIAISVLIHAFILVYLIVPTRATYTPQKQYMSVNLNEVILEEPQTKPPEPEPEPEKPKPEPKINEETVQMIQTRVIPTPRPTKTPTPRPSQTPTVKPTEKPTSTPTKMPTEKPSPKPTNTQAPTKTNSPLPSPTVQPSTTPTPEDLISINDLITALNSPQPTTTGKPNFNYDGDFSDMIDAPGMSDADKNSYGAKLSNHLKRWWKQPRTVPPENRDYSTIISFVIDRQGKVTEAKILTSSGWALMDKTVADALKAAIPVPPLPPTFPSNTVQVRVPFVLNKR